MRLSYSFLNGRLRLTREGGISNTNSGAVNPAKPACPTRNRRSSAT
ncbi:MAG: hypothetical protein WKG07_09835 [Hymenobacter sp.]